MNDSRYQVAVIGCGRMGVDYAEAFHAYHDCNLSALVDPDPSRREEVGRRFGVQASFPDPVSMLRERVPDIVSVVTPTRFIPECVISCAQAGVQAISAEKPITAKLSDGDAMLVACHENGVVFSGGNLQRAKNEVQHAAQVIRDGGIGSLEGACMSLGNELSGGGVQPISVLRLLAGAEVESAVGWVHPPEAAESELDTCEVQGVLHLSSGIECQVFSESAFPLGVQVWGSNGLVRWNWDSPQIFVGFDESGYRIQIEPEYQPYQYSEFDYLTGALRGMISALETGAELPISGHDLCQAVEIAIALKESARRGNVPVSLPLEDRSLSLVPVPYRWDGGHATGGRYPDESGRLLPGWPYDLDGEG